MAAYWLVSGTSAQEIERLTGLRGQNTDQGVLIERPKTFHLDAALRSFDAALNPNRCTCGTFSVLHRPGCPAAFFVT